jgi:hypothetical protein
MKDKNYNVNNTGVGILGVLLIVFIVLKLVGVVTWSWWIVLIPLWIEIGLLIIVVLFIFWLSK